MGAAPLQASDVPSLSASYINNSATLQSPGSFNISGNGLIGGNVGIGTSNPQVPLEVITTAGTGNAIEVTSLGGAPAIYGRRANGTAAAPSNVQLGNAVAVFAARGYGTSAYGGFTGYMDFQATEN